MRYPILLKKIVHRTKYSFNRIGIPSYIQVDWSKSFNNFGDILNPLIIGEISSKKILNVNSKYCNTEHLLAIGSILDRATTKSIVWGSGYISAKSTCISEPQLINAVRGPLTRKLLLKNRIKCPEIYGDPALLLPQFYSSEMKKKYKLGILAHYVDKNSSWLKQFFNRVKIIDVQNPNPLKVIDELCECENIASSSLHGLIVSDAYNIPSVWIQFSDKLTGGKFKFHDYFLSINSTITEPYIIQPNTEPEELIKLCRMRKLNIDLSLLLDNFPKDYR